MSAENKKEGLNIELTEEVAEGTYSNLAIINHSPSEFVVDFIQMMPGIPKAKVKSRVILTPQHAKRLMKALAENVTKFEFTGAPSGSSASFTIKIIQGATPRTVAVDNFETNGGVNIPVYWPGGVIPTVTNVATAIDIYSYVTFDGGASLYGVVGGQNFS